MKSRPIQSNEVEKFQATMNQAIASLAAARAIYSTMMLSPEQIQSPGASADKGYINLTNAGPALDMGYSQCMTAIFEHAKDDAAEARAEQARQPQVVKMPGGLLPS
jgi:hypothetical protein